MTIATPRWLYHLLPSSTEIVDRYAPASLAREGYVHCSYRGAVLDSARLHFAPGAALDVLRIDPRLLDAPLVVEDTPRGPMPHAHGAIPAVAVHARMPLAVFAAALDASDEHAAPDLLDEPAPR